jgi:hypothetical protein
MEQNELFDEIDPIVELRKFKGELEKMTADYKRDFNQATNSITTAIENEVQRKSEFLSDFQEANLSTKKELTEISTCIQQTVTSLNQQAGNVNSQFQVIDKQLKYFSKDLETMLYQSIARGTEEVKVQVDYSALRNYLNQALIEIKEATSSVQHATENINLNIDNTLKNAQKGVDESIKSYRENTTPVREFARLRRFIYSVAGLFLMLLLIQFGITWHSSAEIIGSRNKALMDSSDVWENQAVKEYIKDKGATGEDVRQYVEKTIQERAEQNKDRINFFR